MNLAMNMPFSSILDSIGWTVVHFLWQGVVIGGLAFLAISSLQRRSASERYFVALLALFCCAISFVVTLSLELSSRIAPPSDLSSSSAAAIIHELGSSSRLMNIIAWIWALGAGTLGFRIFIHWLLAQRLKTLHVSQPDQHWLDSFASLTHELGLTTTPRFLQSAIADVPMVVGCLAPVVLVPVSAFTSLTPEQLKSVLAHELWHIRRRDPWVNALQIAIETILFFHPAVWWLSSQVRLEREHCCDDAAVRSAGNPRVFAEALARLETLRIHIPATALSSNGGPLMNRIARMIGAPRNRSGPGWLPMAALGAGMLILSAVGIAHAGVTVPRSDEEIVVTLRDAVASNSLSPDDARALYSTLAYAGSEREAETLAMMTKVFARIDGEAASGKLTSTQAAAQKQAVQSRLDGQQQVAFAVDVLGKSPMQARLDLTAATFQTQVARGEMTQKDAETRLATIKKQLIADQANQKGEQKPVGVLKEQPVASTLSAPDAAAKLAALKQQLTQAQPTQAEFEKMHATIKQRVMAGEVKPEDARARLTAAKQQLLAASAPETAPTASTKPTRADFEKLHTSLKAKVAAGEITQADMDAQIKAYRDQLIKANPR